MKYIIAENKAKMTIALIFDAHLRHKDVAKSALIGDHRIVSAGVCSIDWQERRVACCGESRSLEAVSRPTDSIILTREMLK